MKRALIGLAWLVSWAPAQPATEAFSLEEVLGSPFPSSLVASPEGARIAWVTKTRGRHAIQVAEGPEFAARELVRWPDDDGQTVTLAGFTHDGRTLVFTRGTAFNPGHAPGGPPGSRVYRIGWRESTPAFIANASRPVVSPTRAVVAYAIGSTVWEHPIQGPRRRLFRTRGNVAGLRWSPDGKHLAFTVGHESGGEAYGYIGIFDVEKARVSYPDGSVHLDRAPRWSPDGRYLAYIRRLSRGASSVLMARTFPVPDPWTIRLVEVRTGRATDALRRPEPGSFRQAAFAWSDGSTLVMRSERDDWSRLYRVTLPRRRVRALSPEGGMVETFVTDGRGRVAFSGNAGNVDGRTLWIAEGRARPRALTLPRTVAWAPVFTGDGQHLAHLASTARVPAHVRVTKPGGGAPKVLASTTLAKFPSRQLVTPEVVTFPAPDGTTIHGQLFRPRTESRKRRPAVLYFHGGPIRQMLPAWHYRGYYHHAYGFNQYLASRGYVVLSVNFRMGIGYGKRFRDVPDGGPRGASEYQDVLAAARFLRSRDDVDPERIGLWGGSYGGYLTALGLARNSDLFAAGVDFHGVHDWNAWRAFIARRRRVADPERTAWKSSPMADLAGWRSPVLLVHGDDDRNVPFSETITLARSLKERGVPHEVVVLPGEVHSFLLHESWLTAFRRSARFLDRRLRDRATPQRTVRSGAARYVMNLRGRDIEVFTFKPRSYTGDRMIMVLHGTLRNASEYRDHAARMAEKHRALVVAPRFDRERFPSRLYQRGGIVEKDGRAAPPSAWTYRYIPQIADRIRAMEKKPRLPWWIIGHSAGGQFVARMSAFLRTGAERHVAANPGSHLFPTRDLDFGYGFGGLPGALSNDDAIRRYLSAPLTLYLGTADDKPDRYFDRSPSALRQGPGRYQRGQACFAAAQKLARDKGWEFNWRLVEAEGVEHDHTKMFDHPSCGDALFGGRTREVPAFLKELSARLEADVQADGVGGMAAAIVSRGRLVWARGFGFSDREQRRPVTPGTLFRVGSITKSITGIALARLLDDEVVTLEDRVVSHLPEFAKLDGGKPDAREITLGQLASHVGGLAREPSLAGAASGPIAQWEQKLLAAIPATKLKAAPGSRYRYSNIGHGILGLALSRGAQRPYRALVQREVLSPLGMRDSTFVVGRDLRARLATGYLNVARRVDVDVPRSEHAGRGYKVPNGGLYSTVTDLGRLIIGLTDPRSTFLSPRSRELLMTPRERTSYGLGFTITKDGDRTLVGHGGSVAGYTAHLVFDPKTRSGAVLLRNYNRGRTRLSRVARQMVANANRHELAR